MASLKLCGNSNSKIAAAANQEVRQHAAFGRAPRTVLGVSGMQRGHIVGELTLQKRRGVRPRDAKNRQRRQIANDCGVARRNELAVWSAERDYAAVVEACATRGEEIGPGWVHRIGVH